MNPIEFVHGKNQFGINMDNVHAKAKERANSQIERCFPEDRRKSDAANTMWLREYWATVDDMSEPR